MVPSSHRKRPWLAEENDRGPGAQASHRLVALRQGWRAAPGLRPPSSTLKGGRAQGTPDGFGTCPRARDKVADDGSRWRCPVPWHGFDAVTQNGSAASELAADAYHCIMVWVLARRIQGCGHDLRAHQ